MTRNATEREVDDLEFLLEVQMPAAILKDLSQADIELQNFPEILRLVISMA